MSDRQLCKNLELPSHKMASAGLPKELVEKYAGSNPQVAALLRDFSVEPRIGACLRMLSACCRLCIELLVQTTAPFKE